MTIRNSTSRLLDEVFRAVRERMPRGRKRREIKAAEQEILRRELLVRGRPSPAARHDLKQPRVRTAREYREIGFVPPVRQSASVHTAELAGFAPYIDPREKRVSALDHPPGLGFDPPGGWQREDRNRPGPAVRDETGFNPGRYSGNERANERAQRRAEIRRQRENERESLGFELER